MRAAEQKKAAPAARATSAGEVTVRPVRSRADMRRFLRLPFGLYSDVPRWVPPLLLERKRFFNRKRNPFFDHAEAEYFLAWRDDRPVGRITAHVDHRLSEFQDNRWGLFGFFDSERDPAIAAALLAAAEQWLRERDRDRMVGPMEFNTNHECGLLIEGHERPPQILEEWHHPYYRELLEGQGLVKAIDLLKWKIGDDERPKVMPVIFELAEKVEAENGVRLRHMRKRDFHDEVRRFTAVYNEAWSRNWGFVPLTDAELEDQARQLKPILDEDWAMVVEKGDEVVGAALTLPDYNQVLKAIGTGRLLPLGWLRALRARKRIDSFRVFALGVKRDYRHTGVAARLYVEHFDMAARGPMHNGEAGWILETNTAMNRGMEAMGGQIVKRYRIFEKVFD